MKRSRRVGTRRRTLALATVLGVATGLVGTRTIDALFFDTATARLDVMVAPPAIPRPASVTCVTGTRNDPILGLPIAKWAAVSWTPPTGGEAPSKYVIRVQSTGGQQGGIVWESAGPGTTSVNINNSNILLLGNVPWLLTLLLGGGTVSFSVNAVYGTFESPSSWTHHFRPEFAVAGSIGCGSGPAPAGLVAGSTASPTTSRPEATTLPVTTTAVAVTTVPSATSEPATTTAPATTTPATSTTTSTTTSTMPSTTTSTTPSTTEPAPTTAAPATTAVASTTVP